MRPRTNTRLSRIALTLGVLGSLGATGLLVVSSSRGNGPFAALETEKPTTRAPADAASPRPVDRRHPARPAAPRHPDADKPGGRSPDQERSDAQTPSGRDVRPGGVCRGVAVSPANSVQAMIDAHPEGTTFCLRSGTYSLRAPLKPKARQKFIATTPRTAVWTGTGKTQMAINGEGVDGVEIRGLVIERFKGPNRGGIAAVKGDDYWIVDGNELRYNAYSALYHGSHARIQNNYIHHNYQASGAGFRAVGAVWEGNEVAYNGTPGVADSTGTKWSGTRDIIIRRNHYHHNFRHGIWLDGDNLNALVENNRSEYNEGAGIHYEISCAGTVRNNTLVGNGEDGIRVVASRDVEIYGNTIVPGPDGTGSGGIRVWHQVRGSGQNCAWQLGNVRIHDNDVAMNKGFMGVQKYNVRDGDSIFMPTDTRVTFSNNTYYVSDLTRRHYSYYNNLRTATEWRRYGNDPSGRFLSYSQRPRMARRS